MWKDNAAFHVFHEDTPALVNGRAGVTTNGSAVRPSLMANGVAHAGLPERSHTNGVANGHVLPPQDSPFIGYIIAIHRKMVRGAVLVVWPQAKTNVRPSILRNVINASEQKLFEDGSCQVTKPHNC